MDSHSPFRVDMILNKNGLLRAFLELNPKFFPYFAHQRLSRKLVCLNLAPRELPITCKMISSFSLLNPNLAAGGQDCCRYLYPRSRQNS